MPAAFAASLPRLAASCRAAGAGALARSLLSAPPGQPDPRPGLLLHMPPRRPRSRPRAPAAACQPTSSSTRLHDVLPSPSPARPLLLAARTTGSAPRAPPRRPYPRRPPCSCGTGPATIPAVSAYRPTPTTTAAPTSPAAVVLLLGRPPSPFGLPRQVPPTAGSKSDLESYIELAPASSPNLILFPRIGPLIHFLSTSSCTWNPSPKSVLPRQIIFLFPGPIHASPISFLESKWAMSLLSAI